MFRKHPVLAVAFIVLDMAVFIFTVVSMMQSNFVVHGDTNIDFMGLLSSGLPYAGGIFALLLANLIVFAVKFGNFVLACVTGRNGKNVLSGVLVVLLLILLIILSILLFMGGYVNFSTLAGGLSISAFNLFFVSILELAILSAPASTY